MTDAIVAATFSDFRIVKGRKVAQLTLEVPLEQADAALAALGGVPRPDQERWCGIAPLTPEAAKPKPAPEEPKPKPPRSLGRRVAMVCLEPAFTRFIMDQHPLGIGGITYTKAADFVRAWCNVASRSEIIEGSEAHIAWQALYDDYRLWLDHPELVS